MKNHNLKTRPLRVNPFLTLLGILVLGVTLSPCTSYSQVFKSASNGHVSIPNSKDPLSCIPITRGRVGISITISSTVSASPALSLADMRRLSSEMNSIVQDYNKRQTALIMCGIPRGQETFNVDGYTTQPPNRYSVSQKSKLALVVPEQQAPKLVSSLRKTLTINATVRGYKVKTSYSISTKK